jgi:hypothetical protein
VAEEGDKPRVLCFRVGTWLAILGKCSLLKDAPPAYPGGHFLHRDTLAAMKKIISATAKPMRPMVSVSSKADCTFDCA